MIFIIISILIISSLTACASSPSNADDDSKEDVFTAATLERFRENELMEYEGIRLDPAVGPRDNSITGIQVVDMDTYKLRIDGLVDYKRSYTYDQVLEMKSLEFVYTIYCVEGWDATFFLKGVLMVDLLSEPQVMDSAKTVIFHAVDGYTTSLPLSEILDNNLMIAYEVNGLPLPASLGYPFIFVAQDKWGYKWARWINRIELSSDTNYKGYWESRGYSIDGDLPENKVN